MAQINLAETAAASVATPASGKVAVYADDSTHLPSYKDSAGATHGLVGATGPAGPTGPSGLDPIAPHDYGSITGTATFDRADGPMSKGLVTGAVTITPAFTGVTAGDDALLIMQTTQDGTGGHAITIVVAAWDGDGTAPVFPTTAGTVVSWYVELMPDGTILGRKSGAQGIPGLVWLGAWSSATAYVVGDGVSDSGSSYICTAANTNHVPPNASYWDVLAAQGASGTASVATDPIWTAAGGLAVGTGSSAAAELGIGTDGKVLRTASGAVGWGYPPFHGCRVYNNADQTISHTTLPTVTFNSEYYDTDAYHDTVTNPTRITIGTGLGGKYGFGFTWRFTGTPGKLWLFQARKNGTTVLAIGQPYLDPGGDDSWGSFSSEDALADGDYIEIVPYTNDTADGTLEYVGNYSAVFWASLRGA